MAASAAIPVLFCPVEIPGRDDGPFIDGGKADRVGLEPWLRHCEERGKEIAPLTICHVIARSSPWSGRDRCGLSRVVTQKDAERRPGSFRFEMPC